MVPSWDLKTLWVNDDTGNALTPINPVNGTFGKNVPVEDPYTMAVKDVLRVQCAGVNHADFSPDGRYFIATCEFSGDLIKVDTVKHTILGRIHLPGENPMPQDIKISPDGRTWYVAMSASNRTDSASGPSRAATPSATPASCGSRTPLSGTARRSPRGS